MNDKDLNMSDAFIEKILALPIRHIDTSKDIAWPNSDFEPSGKDAYLEFVFVPVDTSTDTKDFTGVRDSGFAQVSIFTKLNKGEGGEEKRFDKDLLQIRGDLKSAFKPNTALEYDGTKVFISDLSQTPPSPSESWYQSVLTINFYSI